MFIREIRAVSTSNKPEHIYTDSIGDSLIDSSVLRRLENVVNGRSRNRLNELVMINSYLRSDLTVTEKLAL